MLKNQTVWLVKKSLMPNQSDKLLDITDSVLWFCGCLFISKHHNSIIDILYIQYFELLLAMGRMSNTTI